MESFDFDAHFRRLEQANPDELDALMQPLRTYLTEPSDESAWRRAQYHAFLERQMVRDRALIDAFREINELLTEDFWLRLTPEQQADIEAGVAALLAGRKLSAAEVFARYR